MAKVQKNEVAQRKSTINTVPLAELPASIEVVENLAHGSDSEPQFNHRLFTLVQLDEEIDDACEGGEPYSPSWVRLLCLIQSFTREVEQTRGGAVRRITFTFPA